jgi:pimeloyl-ACP methyl ester carboxylesterase
VLLAVLVDGACCTSGTYGDDVFELVSLNPTDWFEVNFRTICSPHTAPERIEEIAFDVRRCAPEVAFHDIKAYAALDLQNQMKNIPAPLVFLHGEDDWSIPPELGRRTAALAAGRTVFTALRNVVHFPHTEHPEAFNTAFVEALQSIDFRLSAD